MKTEPLIKLEHKYRMEEIEAKRKAELEVERVRHENSMSHIRLKTANIRNTIGSYR
jgi:hypothetical protein